MDSTVEQTMRELRDRAIHELFSRGSVESKPRPASSSSCRARSQTQDPEEVKARLAELYAQNPTGVERRWPEDMR